MRSPETHAPGDTSCLNSEFKEVWFEPNRIRSFAWPALFIVCQVLAYIIELVITGLLLTLYGLALIANQSVSQSGVSQGMHALLVVCLIGV